MEYEQYQRLTARVKDLAETEDAKEFFEKTRELMGAALPWGTVEAYMDNPCSHFYALVPQYPSAVWERFGEKRRREHEGVSATMRQLRDERDYPGMLEAVRLMTITELVIRYHGRSRWRRFLWQWRKPQGDALMNLTFKALEYQDQLAAFICLSHLTNGKLAERLEHLSDYFRNRCLALALALREVILSPDGGGR
jgi:hypothetical protein